jgi:hypothetical protein
MKVGRFPKQLQYSMIGALVLLSVWPSRAQAQDDHMHAQKSEHQEQTAAQKKQAGVLIKAVQDATDGFQHFEDAEGQGFHLLFGCVSGGDFGAMGMHFVNMDRLNDGKINVKYPEIILYEPLPNGDLRLTGADYFVYKDTWDADPKNKGLPPELMGQLFHLFDAPNRFGLRAFYTLHVWAWKDNPNGSFVNWNPNVSCDGFDGKNPPGPM